MSDHAWEPFQSGFGSSCAVCGVSKFNNRTSDVEDRPCPGSISVNVRIDGDYSMRVGDIWPDGDYPDEITAEAVAEVMRRYRSDLADDWCLTPDYLVSVGAGSEVTV